MNEEETTKKKKEPRFVAVNVPETFTPALQDNVEGTITKDVFEILAQIRNDIYLLTKNIG